MVLIKKRSNPLSLVALSRNYVAHIHLGERPRHGMCEHVSMTEMPIGRTCIYKEITSVLIQSLNKASALVTARFFSCVVWDFGVMALRALFCVLSALTLCSKFAGDAALEAWLGWDGLEFLSTTAESTPGFDPQAAVHTNNMADQLRAFDESLLEWETLTSKNGASFRVGREKTDCVKGDAIKVAPGKKPFSIDVYWPVKEDWQPTCGLIAWIMGISRVKLSDSRRRVLRYDFQFYNTETYVYYFYDENGDAYHVETFAPSMVTVSYDSEEPKIKKVSGRSGWNGLEFLSTTAESTPGVDPQATTHINNMADQQQGKKSFSADVDWPVDNIEKLMKKEFSEGTGIHYARLKNVGKGYLFQYLLRFRTFHNYFYDESGHCYEGQDELGLNYIFYDSKKLTIKKVTSL